MLTCDGRKVVCDKTACWEVFAMFFYRPVIVIPVTQYPTTEDTLHTVRCPDIDETCLSKLLGCRTWGKKTHLEMKSGKLNACSCFCPEAVNINLPSIN